MAITTRLLRRVLLVAGIALIAVILGFVGYARYRVRRLVRDLPKRLGVDIKQETNGFTYSQSIGGRTVFTVHASKEIQRVNGRITLHDVGITVYGRTPGNADRIHGNDFEYDPADGTLTASGEVFLDLQAPEATAAPQSAAKPGTRVIHVKTSGLVFLEKQRSATTSQLIEFESGGLRGSAMGASFNSADGKIVLQRDVKVTGVRDGRPLGLTAEHAELDRSRNLNFFQLSSAVASETTASGRQTISADQAIGNLTADGSLTSVQASGHVLLKRDSGGSLSGDRLAASFRKDGGPSSVLRQAHLTGNVYFEQQGQSGLEQGRMRDVNVEFDSEGQPAQATLEGDVALAMHAPDAERKLQAQRVQLNLHRDATGRSVLQTAQAFGVSNQPVQLEMIGPANHQSGVATTKITAQHLTGHFVAAGRAVSLRVLEGEGSAEVEQKSVNPAGRTVSDEQSTGDTLSAQFTRSDQGRMLLAHVEQHGHVNGSRSMAAHTSKAHPAQDELERFRASNAVYEAAADSLVLNGSVAIADSISSLLADKVAFDRTSGIATAEGAVRVSYQARDSLSDPLHITAARAVSNRASNVTQFFGDPTVSASRPHGQARLWQGGSQLQAAEIVFDRSKSQVIATGSAEPVTAVFAGSSGAKPGVTRVTSRELIYREQTGQIELNGAVKLSQGMSRLETAHALVQLAQAAAGQQKPSTGPAVDAAATSLMSARIDRITADGAVQLSQPGRQATGDRLVYTSSDSTYILTGTRSAPPRVIDESRGTITGASLRFHGSDDSVEVSGGDGQRVRSETHLQPIPKRR
jgi:lipopolysaccharide export system protein LptA